MAKKRSPYSPEQLTSPLEPPSLIKKVGSGVVSGLSAVGNVLDLPGSSVRDVLAGKNPLDQWASPTSSLNRTSGRDLLRQHGLIGHKDTYGNFFGGLGAEILTDPLLPYSLGKAAVGNAGKLVKAAGMFDDIGRVASQVAKKGPGSIGMRQARLTVTPRQIIEHGMPGTLEKLQTAAAANKLDLPSLLDEPLGGLAKFWPTGTVLGQGELAQKFAGMLDKAGNAVRFGKIAGVQPVNDLYRHVSAKSMNATDPATLEAARTAFSQKEAARAGVRYKQAQWANQFKDAGLDLDKHGPEIRNWLEFPDQAPAHVKPIVDDIRQFLDPIPGEAAKVGMRFGSANFRTLMAEGKGLFAPRFFPEKLVKTPPGAKSQPLAATAQSRMGRYGWGYSSQEGTAGISKLARYVKELRDQGILNTQDIANALKAKFPGLLKDEYLTGKQVKEWMKNVNTAKYGMPTVASAKAMAAQGLKMAKKFAPSDSWEAAAKSLSRLSDEALDAGIYANHPLVDIGRSVLGTHDAIASSRVALDHLIDLKVAGQGGDVPLEVVLKGLKLDKGNRGSGAVKYVMDGMQAKGLTMPDLNSMKPKEAQKAINEFARTFTVPSDTAKFLTQMKEGWQAPPSVDGLLKIYDQFTTLTKAIFTSLKPSFHGRNLPSGQAANALSEQFSAQAVKDVNTLIRGGVIEGAAKNPFLQAEAAKRGVQNLTDDQATKILSELMYAHEVTGSYGVQELAPSSGQLGGSIQDILQGIPGQHPFSFKEVGKKLIGQGETTLNPLKGKWRGLAGAEQSTFGPLAAGEDIGHLFESYNRGGAFWALLQNGISPEEAAKRVLEAQVGYQNRFYTKTEQQILQRVFLFYKFSKGMLPFTLRQLIENPGGRLAQALRSINQTKDEDELVPSYIAETASIPLGNVPGMQPLEPGAKRYVTGLGMGFEDPAQFAVASAQNALLELASRANPFIKGPLEHMTGQSFFQRGPLGGGRSLEDLDPALGRTLSNLGQLTGLREKNTPVTFPGSRGLEHLLSNSPLSTLLTTARTATDPRKGVGAKVTNLLTGVRVSDVSPAAQDRELLNRAGAIEKQLLGAREYRDTYIPKDRQAEFSPKEQELSAELKALRRLLEERRKRRQ